MDENLVTIDIGRLYPASLQSMGDRVRTSRPSSGGRLQRQLRILRLRLRWDEKGRTFLIHAQGTQKDRREVRHEDPTIERPPVYWSNGKSPIWTSPSRFALPAGVPLTAAKRELACASPPFSTM